MKKVAFIFLILISCSKPETIYRIEPELQSYVDLFFSTANDYGKHYSKDNLIVRLTHDLVKLKGGLGVTTLQYENNSLGQRTIEFDYDFWMKSTESVRQTLSLHEFGHAYLGRSHTMDYSLMNINIDRYGWPICPGSVECDHKFLLDELFRNQ